MFPMVLRASGHITDVIIKQSALVCKIIDNIKQDTHMYYFWTLLYKLRQGLAVGFEVV